MNIESKADLEKYCKEIREDERKRIIQIIEKMRASYSYSSNPDGLIRVETCNEVLSAIQKGDGK